MRYFTLFEENFYNPANYTGLDDRLSGYPKFLAIVCGLSLRKDCLEFTKNNAYDLVKSRLTLGPYLCSRFAFEGKSIQDCINYAQKLHYTPYLIQGARLIKPEFDKPEV